MGAWIEIAVGWPPLWARIVAPFMGAWIEIWFVALLITPKEVAPFMGAWIEIDVRAFVSEALACRTLHGCVD